MTEYFKAQEKIQLSNKEIANLSDAQFKTLVIKMLTELVEFVRKVDEKMKPMPRETKENVQGTNSDVKETGTQINGVDQKEERNIQPEQNEETRIRKNEERLRNLHQMGPILLWVGEWNGRHSSLSAPVTYSVTAQQPVLAHPWENLRLCPFK